MHADTAPGREPAKEPSGPAGGDPDVVKTLGLDRPPRRWRKALRVLVPIVLVVLVAGLVFRCVRERAARAIPEYKTAEAKRADIQVTITATGKVKGLNTVEVGAEVSGRITKVHVDFNDPVHKGQVLAEIDPEQLHAEADEAAARVTDADAMIRQARATLTEARQNAERAEQQAAQGLISQKDLEAAKAAAERAEAALASARASATVARANLKSAKSKLGKTTVVAPIDGVVLSRLVEPGQTVTAGFETPVLFKLAEDLRRMSLNVFIDEADVGRAREGQEASFTVDAYPDRTFPSKVLSLRNEPKIEQNVVSYEAVLAVNNDELLLRPGMTATATIVADARKDVLAVPNAALRFTPPFLTAGGPFSGPPKQADDLPKGPRVWVLRDPVPGAAPEPVPVTPGVTDGVMTEIVSGELAPGAQVVVDVVEKEPP